MSESLFIMLKDHKHLNHATLVNSSLIIEWDVDTSYKSDFNWNCFLRDNASS
jgi:hypothetical protein